MINLADEIFQIFNRYGYTRDDIAWIGNAYCEVDVGWFLAIADNTVYDNGYGTTEIPTDLIIMMTDGNWFSRREYDGAEWFVLNTVPSRPAIKKDFTYDKLAVPYEVQDRLVRELDYYPYIRSLTWYVSNSQILLSCRVVNFNSTASLSRKVEND